MYAATLKDYAATGKFLPYLDYFYPEKSDYEKEIEKKNWDKNQWRHYEMVGEEKKKTIKESYRRHDFATPDVIQLYDDDNSHELIYMRWDKEALAYFDKVLAHHPQDVEALVQKAKVYLDLNNYDEVLKYLDKAVKAEPESNYLYRAMAVISLIQKKYDDFKRYSRMSDEPLTESELQESIALIESGDKFSISMLLEGLRNNMRY